MSTARRAWALWVDWCDATGHDPTSPTPDALKAFGAQVPGTRPGLVPGEVDKHAGRAAMRPDPWAVAERAWVDLDSALARCAVFGWPYAVPGRRDAWLLVSTRLLRMPRHRAAGMRARDLPAVIALLPQPRHGHTCSRCVAKRWLEVVDIQAAWSRVSVRAHVWRRPAQTWSPPLVGSALPCDGGCDGLERLAQSLPGHTVVVPAIDKHGWWNDWKPVSTRAVTAILAHRGDPYGDVLPPEEPPVEALDPVSEFDETTLDRLDEVMSAADEVNARLEKILAELGG